MKPRDYESDLPAGVPSRPWIIELLTQMLMVCLSLLKRNDIASKDRKRAEEMLDDIGEVWDLWNKNENRRELADFLGLKPPKHRPATARAMHRKLMIIGMVNEFQKKGSKNPRRAAANELATKWIRAPSDKEVERACKWWSQSRPSGVPALDDGPPALPVHLEKQVATATRRKRHKLS